MWNFSFGSMCIGTAALLLERAVQLRRFAWENGKIHLSSWSYSRDRVWKMDIEKTYFLFISSHLSSLTHSTIIKSTSSLTSSGLVPVRQWAKKKGVNICSRKKNLFAKKKLRFNAILILILILFLWIQVGLSTELKTSTASKLKSFVTSPVSLIAISVLLRIKLFFAFRLFWALFSLFFGITSDLISVWV